MTEAFLAEGAIEVGHHKTADWFGLTVNVDTVTSSAIAAVIVIGLAFFLARQGHLHRGSGWCPVVLRGDHRPDAQPDRERDRHANRTVCVTARRHAFRLHPDLELVVGAAVAILRPRKDHRAALVGRPQISTYVLALALFVFICYHVAGIWRRGIIGHPVAVLKGHVAVLAPINVVEELAKPISLSLRLFGNIFAGGILVSLIALFPPYILWAPNAIWKAFDLFVGAIQAFIFALLTILYFSQAMELEGEHE